jgi:glycosyltransferase involved in cell wall biosynthesis
VPREKCILIENAIDTEEFRRSQRIEKAKARLGIAPQRLLVGAVGRLSAEKGLDLLIRALDRLLQQGLDVGLIIAGEGEQFPALQALINEMGHADRIHLLGYRSDPRHLYEAMDVYALTSFREGLPNVLLEALAMEVPVVATRIAGIPRLIQSETNGLLVEPGDLEGLTQTLSRLLQHPGLRSRLRQAGRMTIEARYSFLRRIEAIGVIYDELLESQHRARSCESLV